MMVYQNQNISVNFGLLYILHTYKFKMTDKELSFGGGGYEHFLVRKWNVENEDEGCLMIAQNFWSWTAFIFICDISLNKKRLTKQKFQIFVTFNKTSLQGNQLLKYKLYIHHFRLLYFSISLSLSLYIYIYKVYKAQNQQYIVMAIVNNCPSADI